MSIESVARVLNAATGVPAGAKLVLIGIANHDGDGGAWPSIATLARYAEMSPRTVQRHIATLVDAGLVQRIVQGGGTMNRPDHTRPNLYRVTVTSPPDTSVTPPPDMDVTPTPDTHVTPPLTLVSPEPSLNHPCEPSSEPSTALTLCDDFDAWWEMYPRKVARADARKAWGNMNRQQRQAARYTIAGHVAMWRKEGRSTKTIPYPATWLRRESWDDELIFTAAQPARTSPNGMGAVMRRLQQPEPLDNDRRLV